MILLVGLASTAYGSRNAAKISRHQVSLKGSERPMDKVSKADESSAAHVANMITASNMALMSFSQKSMTAVMTHTQLTKADLDPVNDATRAVVSAKELQSAVGTHKVNTVEFFNAVDRYKEKDAERGLALATQQELADNSSAENAEQHQALIDTLETQTTKLYCHQLHTKLSLLQKLLNQFAKMKDSHGDIQDKTRPMGGEHDMILSGKNDVRSNVAKGLSASREWANTELLDVCTTLAPGSLVMEKFTFLADLVKDIEGSDDTNLLQETSTCSKVVKAVIGYFDGAIQEVEDYTHDGAFGEKCGIAKEDAALDADTFQFDEFADQKGESSLIQEKMSNAAAAPPPADQVIAGLNVAKEHATSIQGLAMDKQQEINKKMQEAVEKGEMVDMEVVMNLNKAIQKSLEAKQLSDKVSQHVDESKEFFELVSAFKQNNEQMELVKEELKNAHEAKTAHSEKEMKAAKDAWKTTIDNLVKQQTAQERAGLADLLSRWDGLHASLGEITTKSEGLGVTVHNDVATGKKTAEQWANDALKYVCEKKGAGKDWEWLLNGLGMFSAESACSKAVRAGA
jgi:hypothetical protein